MANRTTCPVCNHTWSGDETRNIKSLRFFWALCGKIGMAVGWPKKTIANLIKTKLGHVEIVKTKSMGVVQWPKSIAYNSLTEAEWRPFLDGAVHFVIDEAVPGLSESDLRREIYDMCTGGSR